MILDVMMPGTDGLSLCSRIRAETERLAVAIEKNNSILKEAQEYYDERAELFDAHSELWDKLWDNMSEKQIRPE